MAEVEFYYKDNVLKIYISGEIDHHSAFAIKDEIDCQLLYYTPETAVMNFEKVSFMDSSGIAVIINALRNMTRIQGELYVCGLQNQPLRVFLAAGVDKLVAIKEVSH